MPLFLSCSDKRLLLLAQHCYICHLLSSEKPHNCFLCGAMKSVQNTFFLRCQVSHFASRLSGCFDRIHSCTKNSNNRPQHPHLQEKVSMTQVSHGLLFLRGGHPTLLRPMISSEATEGQTRTNSNLCKLSEQRECSITGLFPRIAAE